MTLEKGRIANPPRKERGGPPVLPVPHFQLRTRVRRRRIAFFSPSISFNKITPAPSAPVRIDRIRAFLAVETCNGKCILADTSMQRSTNSQIAGIRFRERRVRRNPLLKQRMPAITGSGGRRMRLFVRILHSMFLTGS